jgi:hypothetical protein
VPSAQHQPNETGARTRRPSLLTGLLFDENVCSSGDDLGTGSKRPLCIPKPLSVLMGEGIA